MYENKNHTHTYTHYKEKLIISLLDLEQSKTKSIIYKALSEERKKQLNGHVKPQQKRNKIHKFTHTRTHRHANTNTQKQKNNTHTHTLTQVMRMQNLIQF